MRFTSSALVVAFVGLLSLVSCSKQETISYHDMELKAFESWIGKWKDANPDQASSVKQHLNGMYYILDESGVEAGAPIITPNSWAMVNYTGTDVNGDVFVSRDSTVTKLEGTFTKITHYVPEFIYVPELVEYITQTCPGMYDGLVGLKKGSKMKLFIPSYLAYGSSGVQYQLGYQGQYSLGSNRQIEIDLEVMEVVADPAAYELQLVKDYITADVGNTWVQMKDDEGADLEGIYLCKGTENTPSADLVSTDKTAMVYYSGLFLTRFTDENGYTYNQQFDRNAPTKQNIMTMTQKAADGYGVSSNGLSTYIDGFQKTVKRMKYNSSMRVIMTSTYGYAESGNNNPISSETAATTASAIIRPYEPLIFEIYVAPYTATR